MKNINKHSGYSVIVALLLIGFLLVLTIGIFTLVLNEMKGNKAMGNYIKAYAGAESSRELALLQIKRYGYAYYDKIDHNINNRSVVLSDNPLDQSLFKKNNDVFISFDLGSMTNEYDGILKPLGYDIIPLFYVNKVGEQKTTNIDLSILFGTDSELAWNIIGKNNGISGKGTNLLGSMKSLTVDGFKYSEEDANAFLQSSNSNYLVLLNAGNSSVIKYKLKATNLGEFFSKPKTSILSSAEVGQYKQNINTDLDNTEFLNILKYSIYSN